MTISKWQVIDKINDLRRLYANNTPESLDLQLIETIRLISMMHTVEPKYRVLEPVEWMGTGTDRAMARKASDNRIVWIIPITKDADTTFTMDEIKRYHLVGFECEEVKEDD